MSEAQRAVQELIDELVSALMNARVYFPGHPRVQLSIDNLAATVRRLTGAERGSIRLAVAGGYVLFANRPVVGASLAAGRLIEVLERVGSGGVELSASCSADAIRALVEALAARQLVPGSYRAIDAMLQQRQDGAVRLLPPFRAGSEACGELGGEQLGVDGASDRVIVLPTRIYQGVLSTLQDVTVSACQGGSIALGAVHTEAENLLKGLDQASGPMMNLASQHEYDAFTLGHSLRVTMLAMDFARGLGASRELMRTVGVAGLLHDVGKAKVPFEILHSRRALSSEERAVVNTHPEHGARILLDQLEVEPLAVAAAFGHHRRADGEGYPRTMHEHRASVATRIVQICDVYEALTAARPYKAPMSAVRAYRMMISMRGHFDARLLHRFIHRNGVFANGSTVRLSTGERALVMEQSKDLLRPRVVLVSDREGNEVPWQERATLDLSDPALGIGVAAAEPQREEAAAPAAAAVAPASPVEGCCGPLGVAGPSS